MFVAEFWWLFLIFGVVFVLSGQEKQPECSFFMVVGGISLLLGLIGLIATLVRG